VLVKSINHETVRKLLLEFRRRPRNSLAGTLGTRARYRTSKYSNAGNRGRLRGATACRLTEYPCCSRSRPSCVRPIGTTRSAWGQTVPTSLAHPNRRRSLQGSSYVYLAVLAVIPEGAGPVKDGCVR
jgi:hypothetical protein